MMGKNINISSSKNDFENVRHVFQADGNRNTIQQKSFHNFLKRKVGASERTTDLEQ